MLKVTLTQSAQGDLFEANLYTISTDNSTVTSQSKVSLCTPDPLTLHAHIDIGE